MVIETNQASSLDNNGVSGSKWDNLIARVDKNNDGKISKDELSVLLSGTSSTSKTSGFEAVLAKVFQKMDKDKNGQVSQDEFNQFFQSGIKSTGTMTAETAKVKGGHHHHKLELPLSTDGTDTLLSNTSRTNMANVNLDQLFNQMDNDKDGFINQTDFIKFDQTLRAQLFQHSSADATLNRLLMTDIINNEYNQVSAGDLGDLSGTV
ncbi:MAG: EF-hand domain-containing protein [Candidatus Margulisbacteria bacterium]|nr:EF-hand domain-containing protein [Candidatus Margulisiibacteriota bacterium]